MLLAVEIAAAGSRPLNGERKQRMPDLLGLHDQPGHLIRRAHQIAVAVFLDTLGREVTPVQYAVLMLLAEKPGIDQATLAQEAALDTSTTADIAARLEAKGWIVRHVLARGQRSLELTAAGAKVLAGLEPGIARLQQALLGGLSPREQADFMRLLRKFVHINNERSRAPLQRGDA
jgi:DNA-binding MarR family transcriptional regulator